ncbi:Crp/Fnr family transcriptional regulator [Campylobacter coli]|nr:Crp/Fnr family transcriptional regulator [Campylobacter coli]EAJ3695511.1 Crp/Fnr family transcriptional regulator [Campylobacter coli]EDO9260408.1 helix-turn-helix domain-containing protein [Campylobacter coli]EEV5391005.1 Crp/Fnr family transcriptional regulator [Campylobacter coli]EGM0098553.1 Crp/Fnr family transcriptional regulator [Campylobacter coli]
MDKEKILKEYFKNYNLENKDFEAMVEKSYFKEFDKNTILDDCLGFVIVLKGGFRAFILGQNAKEITVFKLKQNEECVICSYCIFETISYNLTLESFEDTQILIVPVKIYSQLKDKYPLIANYTLNLIAKRFNSLINILEQALFTPLHHRVKMFLKENAKEGKITFTHEEIALHLGSTREVISRILKTMQKEGFIQQNRKEITLLKDL